MELIERLPLLKIQYLNEIDFKSFKPFCSSKNDDERKIKFNMMKSFCQTNIKTRGETKRIYSYTQTTPHEVGGRLYCGNSIQGLQRDFRGFLLNDITTDIDMKNAHPVILKYLCLKNNILCPNLTYYIENRETVLKQFDENGKFMFLKSVNDDKINKKEKNEFFKAFDKECKRIQKQITCIHEYEHIVNSVPEHKLHNWLGSAINRILCVYENKIIQSVIGVLNPKQIEICSLMFDGIMVYGDHYDNVKLLSDIEERVKNDFNGLNMLFAFKSHSNKIILPDGYILKDAKKSVEELKNDPSFKLFESVCCDFETEHAKIINKSIFVKEFKNEVIVMSKQQIKISYENKIYSTINKIDNRVENCNFINKWLVNNPTQRCYDDIGVFPKIDLCPTNIYNMWRPFAMEDITEYVVMEDAKNKILNHILILCGNDKDVCDYFCKWIGQMIQYPNIKSICPTLISKEGAGKGTLLQLMSLMLGSKKVYETSNPGRDVWGDFNGCMCNTFLVNLNELSKKDCIESEGKIKALITDPKITINNKGISQYDIDSYHRFIITTNNLDPIKTTKDDRRKIIIRSSDELCGNKNYFNELYELLGDVNVVKTCYEYFKSIPNMDKFNLIPIISTEYQNNLKSLSESPIEMWLKSYVMANDDKDVIELLGKDSYVLFVDWCSVYLPEFKTSLVKFGVNLTQLNINGVTKGRHTKKGKTKYFNIQELKTYFGIGLLIELSE